MADPESFDLDESIRQWRNRMSHEESLNETELTEMESHLRDAVESLQDSGLSPAEAFLVACHRMGDAGRVGAEFRKIHQPRIWSRRIAWMLVGYLLFLVVELMVSLASQLTVTVGAFSSLSAGQAAFLSSAVSAIGWGLFLFALIALSFDKLPMPRVLIRQLRLRSAWWLLVLPLWVGFVYVAKMLLSVVLARFWSPESFGIYAQKMMLSQAGITTLVLLAVLVGLKWLLPKSRTTAVTG